MTSPFALSSLLLTLLLSFASSPSASAATAVKRAFITCVDRSGVVLGRDTVTTPIAVCAFVKPRTIPFYKPINYSEDGWEYCQTTDVWMTIEYGTEGVPAIEELLAPTDTIGQGMSFLVGDAQRPLATRALLTAGTAGETLRLQTLATEHRASLAQPWTLSQRNGKWQLFNEATEQYLAAPQSHDNSPVMGDRALNFKLVKTDISGHYALRTAEGKYLDLRGETPTLSNDSTAVVLHRYRATPFFAVRAHAINSEGDEIQNFEKQLYPAGAQVDYAVPTIDHWDFDPAATTQALSLTMNTNHYLELHYQRPTAIVETRTEITNKAQTRFDLSGRRVATTHKGIVLTASGKRIFR